MKRFIWIWLFFWCAQLPVFAQLDAKSINFGLIKYTVNQENLPPQSLEKILNAFSSIGDKDLMLQESLLGMLSDEGPEMDFEQMEEWWSDFTPEDSARLSGLLPMGMNYRERPLFITWMTYFGHGYQQKISWIEGYLQLQKYKDEHFSHLPEPTDIYDGFMDLVYSHYSYAKWYLAYPEELMFFKDQLKQQAQKRYGSDSDEDILKWSDELRHIFLDSNTIYKDYLPASMTPMVMHTRAMLKAAAASPHQNSDNDFDLDIFTGAIRKLYKFLYETPIPEELMTDIMSYMDTNKDSDPRLIVVALILSKYE